MLERRPVEMPRGSVSACLLVTVLAASLAAPLSASDLLEWKKGDLKLTPTAYVQGDLRAFPGWDVDLPGLRSDWGDVRRARVGGEAKYKELYAEASVDLATLISDGAGDNDGGERAFSLRRDLKNAYAEMPVGKHHYLRVGHFKLPTTREFLTPVSKIDFVERSLLANGMAPGRDWGVMAGGHLKAAHGLDYMLGVFAGDGWSDDSRAATTLAGRLVLEPVRSLQVAAWANLANVDADVDPGVGVAGAVDPVAKGLRGKSASGWTFFHRMHVDGQRRRLGTDVQYVRGALTLKADLMHARDERNGQGSTFDDLPSVSGLGWSTVAIWRLMGPRSKKDETKVHPLDVLVRYESLKFDDDGEATGFEGIGNRARNIRPESSRALTGGVNYWPRTWIRLMGNAVLESYNDALLVPERDRKGTYVTLLARVQITLP
jgi:phosphate-selective porin